MLGGCNRTAPDTKAIPDSGPADVTLHIGPVLVDIAKDHTISTLGYNGSVPGPVIRMREGGGFLPRWRPIGHARI